MFVLLSTPMQALASESQARELQPGLLSAFFGLDNSLPFAANMLCLGASGKDGMPVIFSHTIDETTLDAQDFEVVTESGVAHPPDCVTLRPAQDKGELRTVLLIGEFGDADDDPPVTVRVVGDLLAGATDAQQGGRVNYQGAEVAVTPLQAGPFLVLAQLVPLDQLAKDTRGTECPQSTQQVVRVTWAGGVRLPNGDDLGDKERTLYRVVVQGGRELTPMAIADLGDNDNNHLLCLDTQDPAIVISFPAGHLVDPNQDLNQRSQISVLRGVK